MMSEPEQLLGQFEYLADELDAQRFVVRLVPPSLWEARPPDGEPSLMEMVLALVERACHEDRRVLAPWLVRETSDESPDPAPGKVSDRLGVAAAARRRLAADLAAVDEGSWLSPVGDRTLATALYDLIQDDTQRLRRMTQRLFEAGIR